MQEKIFFKSIKGFKNLNWWCLVLMENEKREKTHALVLWKLTVGFDSELVLNLLLQTRRIIHTHTDGRTALKFICCLADTVLHLNMIEI